MAKRKKAVGEGPKKKRRRKKKSEGIDAELRKKETKKIGGKKEQASQESVPVAPKEPAVPEPAPPKAPVAPKEPKPEPAPKQPAQAPAPPKEAAAPKPPAPKPEPAKVPEPPKAPPAPKPEPAKVPEPPKEPKPEPAPQVPDAPKAPVAPKEPKPEPAKVPEPPKEPKPEPAKVPEPPKEPKPEPAPQVPDAPKAPEVPKEPKPEPAPQVPAAEPSAPKVPAVPKVPAAPKQPDPDTVKYGEQDTSSPPSPIKVESLESFTKRDFTGSEVKGYTLERKLGSGGMGAVYFAQEEHGKSIENSRTHQNYYATNRLLYYALNGFIDLRKLGIDEFSQGMKPDELKRAIYQKQGMVDKLASLITSKGKQAAYKILEDPDLAGIVSKLAIKIAPLTDDLMKRSKREAEIQGKASHPNIVGELFSGIEGDIYYMGLEFVDELIRLDQLKESGIDLPPETAFMIGYYVLNVLVHLSEKVKAVHRDVKPSNIMIGKEDFLPTKGGILVPFDTDQGRVYRPGIVKVADLGLATYISQDVTKLTETGITLGTPAFMSPQRVVHGARHTRPSDDVFSLGQTLYYIITGELPFGSFDMELIPLLNKIQDANEDPNFPSRVRATTQKSPLQPFLESFILEMLMKGTKESLQRIHKKEFVEYREARPGPKHFLKRAMVVVDRLPDPYADISYEERHNKICEALQLDPKLSPKAKDKIKRLKAEIDEATKKRDELIGKDETLHDMGERVRVFIQEKRISHANYAIADLLPVSVKKEVDSPDGPRYTKAVFLEWGIERHKRAVELIKRAWVDDICSYLNANVGESAVNQLRNTMRNYLHIGESDLDPGSVDARNDQTVRLLEVLLAKDVHLDESLATRKYIAENAGSVALNILLDSRDAFINFKGERAYDTFIERMGVNEELRSGMMAARGLYLLEALLKSKEDYIALKSEEAYAKLIEPFKGEEDPHAKLIAKLQDEGERKKFMEKEGEAYWNALKEPGKERNEYIKEEGEAALQICLLKPGIDVKAADAYEQLCDLLRETPDQRKDFIAAEGKIVYGGIMDRLAKYSEQTGLDELILREQELTFELWMDKKVKRETATKRSTTLELSTKFELDVDEDFFRVIQEHLNGIINGNPDYKGQRVRGYKELLADMGHPPTEGQLAQLNARMEEAKIKKRFNKIKRRFRLIEEEVTEEGIADSSRPLYEETKKQIEALQANLQVPDLLYDFMLKEREGPLNAELANLEGRMKAIDPEKIKKAESSRDELADLKQKFVASADTIETDMLPTYQNREESSLVESYIVALRVYGSMEIGQDFYVLEEVRNILKLIEERGCFDTKSSLDLYQTIHELTEPLFLPKRLEQVKADVQRAEGKNLGTTKSEVGRCLFSLGMYDQASKYSRGGRNKK